MSLLRDSGYKGFYSAEHHSAKNEYVNSAVQLACIQKVINEWQE
jgi:sugar phosphate isomerase/epimerase